MKNLIALLLFLCLSSLFTLNAQPDTVVTGLDAPSGISIYNDQLYITQSFTDEVSRFSLDLTYATVEAVASLDTPTGTFVLGNDLYVGNGVGVNAGIYRLNLLEANPDPIPVLEDIAVSGVYIRDSILYFSSQNEQSVYTFDLTDETAMPQLIASGLAQPSGLAISDNELFIAEFGNGQVSKLDLTDNSVSVFLTDFDRPYGLNIYGGLLYVSDNASINHVDPNATDPLKTLVVDGLEAARQMAFRGSELYVAQAIGFFGTGIVTRFLLPLELPGDSCQIALGIDSLLGGEIGVARDSRIFNNETYNAIGADQGTECFAGDGPERTIWYRFTGDGNTYEIRTNTTGADDPVGMGDTRIAIYRGSCAELSPIGCNEDENTDLDLLNGRVEIATEAGVPYSFLVDTRNGLDSDGGEFRVEVTRQDTVSSVSNVVDLSNRIYPNPTNGILYFQGESPIRVVVLNAMGRRVFKTTVTSNQLDLSTLPTGLYSLFAQLPDETWASSKVIKR
ncbi:hypothetical protein CEQ90_13660 [Lewinellaceae bacterium SD302]|nr:hypothetical protein CEQ90_13660 [Lewinellaceae bacterium SD302]